MNSNENALPRHFAVVRTAFAYKQKDSAYKQKGFAYKQKVSAYKREGFACKQNDSAYEQKASAGKRNDFAYKRRAFACEQNLSAYERNDLAPRQKASACKRNACVCKPERFAAKFDNKETKQPEELNRVGSVTPFAPIINIQSLAYLGCIRSLVPSLFNFPFRVFGAFRGLFFSFQPGSQQRNKATRQKNRSMGRARHPVRAVY